MFLNTSYTPNPEVDFPIIEKMMTAIEQQSPSCQSLQSIYNRVDKYTTNLSYGERTRHTAGMAQALTQYYRPEGCSINK